MFKGEGGRKGAVIEIPGCACLLSDFGCRQTSVCACCVMVMEYHSLLLKLILLKILVAEVMIYGGDFRQWTETA